MILRPKIRFVRMWETPFSQDRLVKQVTETLREKLRMSGRIISDNLGYGFHVEMGKPQTLREYLFPELKSTTEGLGKLRDLING